MKNKFLIQRISSLKKILEYKKLDVLFLTSKVASRYFADFQADNGFLIVDKNKIIFLTDGRFSNEAKKIPLDIEIIIYKNSILNFIKSNKLLKKNRIGFEGWDVKLNFYKELCNVFPNYQFVDISDFIQEIFSVHDEESIRRTKKAISISKNVYDSVRKLIKAGVTEIELERDISFLHKYFGGTGDSFHPIVAFDKNSCMPHSTPTNKRLEKNNVVMLDFGTEYKGLCSDITRMFFFGSVESKILVLHSILKDLVEQIAAELKSGIAVKDLDLFARSSLRKVKLEKYFVHSLGHGIGFQIHQSPRISIYSEEILKENQIITIEPGVYFENRFGLRVENMYLIKNNSAINLTNFE
ncbi:MAG: hypothetical protein C0425_00895 [Chlorobiaceae bacterium]|nr:hypothetical protein [Chlorobiaceae bacterium]MBA4308879.1 hypothetical protein [Chlorobiaceae bacterium]